MQYSVSFTVHQSETATHIHIFPFFWISFIFRPSEYDGTGKSAIIIIIILISYSLFSTSCSTFFAIFP